MAQTLNQTNAATQSAKHNVQTRQKIMKEVSADLDRLDDKMADLREARKKARKRLKDCDISMVAFDFERRLGKMDKADRDSIYDDLVQAHEALRPGEQVDWLDVATKHDGNGKSDDGFTTAEKDRTEMEAAYREGKITGLAGRNLADCPYTSVQKRLQAEWQRGWSDGQAELVTKTLGKKHAEANGASEPEAPPPTAAEAAASNATKTKAEAGGKRGRPSNAEKEARRIAAETNKGEASSADVISLNGAGHPSAQEIADIDQTEL